jgi:hypothetical protein
VTAGPSAFGPAKKKARLVKAFFTGAPIWCTWQVTPRCGSFCLFCEHRADGAPLELFLGGLFGLVRG